MPVLRLFAAAREAAGVARAELDGATVGAVLAEAELRYGERFSGVLAHSRVWVNGQPAEPGTAVHGHDVIAVLPPVSGGSDADQPWSVKAASPVALDAPENDAEPTQAHEVLWLDDSAPLHIEEPEWLAPEPEVVAGDPIPVDDLGWSGWSSASGSYQTFVPEPAPARSEVPAQPFVPEAPPQPFAPAAPFAPFAPAAPAAPAPLLSHRPAPEAIGLPVDPFVQEKGAPRPPPLLEGGFRRAIGRLAVVHDNKGPHGRLGLLWAVVAVGATIGGPESLAGWMGLTAFVGACQASRVRLGQARLVLVGTSAVIAIALPVAALVGVEAVAAGVGGAAVLSFVAALFFSRDSAIRDGVATFANGVALGLAATAPVLLRAEHIEAAFLLLAYAATYDAGAYLVGTGASSVWEGPVAGVTALIPVVILSAVLLVPPFQSGTPILLGLLAAVLAPLGPLVGSALVGDGEAHAPGVRRLDSLIVLGPIWATASVAFIK